MKRYWVFAGDVCYARGGMIDYVASFDSVLDAIDFAVAEYQDEENFATWYHVFDSVGKCIVVQSHYQAHGADCPKRESLYHEDINGVNNG